MMPHDLLRRPTPDSSTEEEEEEEGEDEAMDDREQMAEEQRAPARRPKELLRAMGWLWLAGRAMEAAGSAACI